MTPPIPFPHGLSLADDSMDAWRNAVVYTYTEAFGKPSWFEETGYISVKPNESGAEAYKRQTGRDLAKDSYVLWRVF